MLGKRSDAPAPRLLRVDRSARPGWKTGAEQPPRPGQAVYCTEGMAEVVRILGKTGDGSRLLELRLLEKEAPPFYAAASNVLVAPEEEAGDVAAATASSAAPAANGATAAKPEESPAQTSWPAHEFIGGTLEPVGGAPEPAGPIPNILSDVSWAIEGSLAPAGPSPAETAGTAAGNPAAPAGGSDTAPKGSAAASTDGTSGSASDEAEEEPALPEIIGTPHGPRGSEGAGADDESPTIPLDPRVQWIG
jgi:hypothetical protein